MLSKLKLNLIAAFLLLFFDLSICQSGQNSPFSRFGFGDLTEGNFFHLQQMGGISAAFADPYHINYRNPASLPYLRATSFDVGLSMNYAKLSDSENSSSSWSGGLENMSLAFPFRNPLNEAFEPVKKKYWIGMNLALVPYSRVDYNISSTETDPNFGDYKRKFEGSGGTYKFLWGTGLRYKEFSIGVNLGYLFGKMQFERNLNFLEIPNAYRDNFINNYSVRSFTWNAGMMYRFVLNRADLQVSTSEEPKVVSIGLFGNPSSSFNTNATTLNQGIYEPSLTQIIYDTLSAESGMIGNGKLPAELSVGVVYFNGSKFVIGMQYAFENWSQYQNDAFPEELSNTYKISAGGYYRPNYKSFKYSDRIFYRFGVFYQQDPRSLSLQQVKNYGVTVGLGLPFIYQRKVSHINLGLTLGKRGSSDILSETFVKLGFALTYNDDEWFIKRRYN